MDVAISTAIPASEWLADTRALATANELLAERAKAAEREAKKGRRRGR